jgi:hypothetical protein
MKPQKPLDITACGQAGIRTGELQNIGLTEASMKADIFQNTRLRHEADRYINLLGMP